MKISPPRLPGKWDCDCSAREEMMLIISKVNSFDLFSRKQKKGMGEKKTKQKKKRGSNWQAGPEQRVWEEEEEEEGGSAA